MKRSFFSPLAGFVLVLVLAACSSIEVDMKDGTARIDRCPGVTFRLIVIQGPNQPSVSATALGGVVRFRSSAFDVIDFSRPVRLIVFAERVPAGSECPLRAGVRYELSSRVLSPVSGSSDTYGIDLGDFTER
ncbi:MAG: hypothetical protein D6701_02315 [Gemmatimonadetes bacterium]|nr:MAG: hypothetical protein D6701_02315 [Gemmatimonadota bacterium]